MLIIAYRKIGLHKLHWYFLDEAHYRTLLYCYKLCHQLFIQLFINQSGTVMLTWSSFPIAVSPQFVVLIFWRQCCRKSQESEVCWVVYLLFTAWASSRSVWNNLSGFLTNSPPSFTSSLVTVAYQYVWTLCYYYVDLWITINNIKTVSKKTSNLALEPITALRGP